MTSAPGLSDERTNHDPIESEQQFSSTTVDPLDDVFGSAPSSPNPLGEHQHYSDPSDVPRLRSTHVTAGYREGIAASKEEHIQSGFDEGYSLGAELGMKAGWVLGVLESLLIAVAAQRRRRVEEPGDRNDGGFGVAKVRASLASAEEDLKVQNLLGKEWFGDDGIWLYDVPIKDGGASEVGFREVANAHPIVKKWTKIALELADAAGLHLQ